MGKENRKSKKKAKVAAKRKNGAVHDFDNNQPTNQQNWSDHLAYEPEKIRKYIVYILPDDGSVPLDVSFKRDTNVRELKKVIERRKGLRLRQQCLRFNGDVLLDSQELTDLLPKNRAWILTKFIYDIFKLTDAYLKDEITIHLQVKLRDDWNKMWQLDHLFFDSQHDKDFRDHKPEIYKRDLPCGELRNIKPVGSYLKALKVRDKYEDNVWLIDEGAWDVAYHGSSFENIQKIIKSGGLQEKFAVLCRHGPGIYCSPDPSMALKYASPYYVEGMRYKAILQVRVLLAKAKVVQNLDIWVAPEKHIRITGICIYSDYDNASL